MDVVGSFAFVASVASAGLPPFGLWGMYVEFVDRVIGVFANAVAYRKFKLGHQGVGV